jgi:hypothetical protein
MIFNDLVFFFPVQIGKGKKYLEIQTYLMFAGSTPVNVQMNGQIIN